MALPSSILQSGTRASQPAATAVAAGTLYEVTDESVVERSNGSAWATYANKYVFVGTSSAEIATAADTVLVDVTGLVFNYVNGGRYWIEFMGRVSAAASTTGFSFALNTSGTVDTVTFQFMHQLANTGTLTGGHATGDDTVVGTSSGNPTNGATFPVFGQGTLLVGSNSDGTAQLRFASEVAAVATLRTRAMMRVMRIN